MYARGVERVSKGCTIVHAEGPKGFPKYEESGYEALEYIPDGFASKEVKMRKGVRLFMRKDRKGHGSMKSARILNLLECITRGLCLLKR